MTDSGTPATSADERRYRLFPALSLTLADPIAQATAIATQGGSLTVTLTNSGLASAYRNYVEVYRLTYPITKAGGFYVWNRTDAGVGFWVRGRVGERIQPDALLREGPPAGAETFMNGAAVAERIGRVAAPGLAPTRSAVVSVAVPALPPAPAGVTELTSWCLVFRCFELLTDPAPAVQLPVPPQPAHHRQLICLHTGP